MSEADDKPEPVRTYVGPYENWVYRLGVDYSFPAIKGGQYHFFSSLINWGDKPRGNDQRRPGLADVNIDGAWLPQLWVRGLGPLHATFSPLVFRFDQGEREVGSQLEKVLGQVSSELQSKRTSEADKDASPKSPTFRVNFPLADATVSEDWISRQKAGAGTDDGIDRAPLPALDPKTPAPAVIVAIIDDGIPFAHRAFLDADGRTRLDYCWLQSAAADLSSSEPLLFGREFTSDKIDRLRKDYPDEDALYREAGAVGAIEELGAAINAHATHGAHVMGIAAGRDAGFDDGANGETVRIIAVQLPNTIAWDTSGFGKEMHMLSAFHYIFERADRIAHRFGVSELPLVINFSYGFSGGPHDGSSELEQAIDELLERRREIAPTALVMPAGNTFMERLHAVVEVDDILETGGSADLFWQIPPGDRTSSYLEIWFPPEVAVLDDWAITIADPSGAELFARDSIRPDQPQDVLTDRRLIKAIKKQDAGKFETIGQFSADHFGGRRWRLLIVLAPTEPEGSEPLPYAEPGRWTISLTYKGEGHPPGPLQCWIQRDEDPAAFSFGARQSYFHDPQNKAFDADGTLAADDTAQVRRYGSLNGLATGRTPIVVGGYVGSSEEPADYSSAGPEDVGPAGPNSVDASAASDDSYAVPGILGIGSRSGAYARWNGTSVAAPRVARALVREFAARPLSEIKAAQRSNYVDLLSDKSICDVLRLGTVRVRS